MVEWDTAVLTEVRPVAVSSISFHKLWKPFHNLLVELKLSTLYTPCPFVYPVLHEVLVYHRLTMSIADVPPPG